MVIILRGISGSGKTHLASYLGSYATDNYLGRTRSEKFFDTLRKTAHRIVLSADDYFMDNGTYKFDPRYLPAAHQSCLRMFAKGLADPATLDKTHTFVIDNTNTTLVEVLPYIALSEAYAQELHVVTLIKDPVECLTRNRHGVPFASIIKQDIHLRQSIIDWPARMASCQQIFHE